MITMVKDSSHFEEIKKGDKLVVVDFYADWCGPCKMIAPKVEEFSKEFTDVVFCKVDVDQQDEIAGNCGISAMPTFQFYKNGEKVDDLTGANEVQLREKIIQNK